MLKSPILQLFPVALLAAAASASAQSVINVTIQSYSDTQSTFSWTATGDWVTGGATVPNTNINNVATVAYANLGGYFTGVLNTNSLPTAYTPVSGFGSFSNVTTGASEPIGGLILENAGGNSDIVAFQLGSYPGAPVIGHAGQELLFTDSSGSTVVNDPITDFNAGTYQFFAPGQAEISTSGLTYFTTSITANVDIMAPTPEPSILALGALGLLGGWALRRRIS